LSRNLFDEAYLKIIVNHRLYVLLPVLCGLVFLLFFAKMDVLSPRSWKQAWNLGHIPLFILVGYAVYLFNPGFQNKNLVKQVLFLALTGFFLGLGIEFLQTFVNRQISLWDVMLDILGAVIAIPLFSSQVRTLAIYHKLLIYSVTCALLIFASWRFMIAVWDEYQAYRQFPILSDFEHYRELDRWTGKAAREIVSDVSKDGSRSLKVSLQPRSNSGIELQYFPTNWSGYELLTMHVFNLEAELLTLAVSIHDSQNRYNRYAYYDRYTEQFFLQHGWNEISIFVDELIHAPKRRHMDITHIRGVRLYVAKPAKGQQFYIDGVRLE